jgi:hypothetical protein
MPADIWIVNLFILGVVLLVDVGHRKVKWGRVYRPFLVALLIVPFFVKSPQLSGKGLVWEAGLLVAGALFGLVAVFGFMRVARGGDGLPYSEAGAAYAAFWVFIIGARLIFSYGAYHWYTNSLGHWMAANHITTNGLTDGLIFLAIAMALARSTRFLPYLRKTAKVAQSASKEATPSGPSHLDSSLITHETELSENEHRETA